MKVQLHSKTNPADPGISNILQQMKLADEMAEAAKKSDESAKAEQLHRARADSSPPNVPKENRDLNKNANVGKKKETNRTNAANSYSVAAAASINSPSKTSSNDGSETKTTPTKLIYQQTQITPPEVEINLASGKVKDTILKGLATAKPSPSKLLGMELLNKAAAADTTNNNIKPPRKNKGRMSPITKNDVTGNETPMFVDESGAVWGGDKMQSITFNQANFSSPSSGMKHHHNKNKDTNHGKTNDDNSNTNASKKVNAKKNKRKSNRSNKRFSKSPSSEEEHSAIARDPTLFANQEAWNSVNVNGIASYAHQPPIQNWETTEYSTNAEGAAILASIGQFGDGTIFGGECMRMVGREVVAGGMMVPFVAPSSTSSSPSTQMMMSREIGVNTDESLGGYSNYNDESPFPPVDFPVPSYGNYYEMHHQQDPYATSTTPDMYHYVPGYYVPVTMVNPTPLPPPTDGMVYYNQPPILPPHVAEYQPYQHVTPVGYHGEVSIPNAAVEEGVVKAKLNKDATEFRPSFGAKEESNDQ